MASPPEIGQLVHVRTRNFVVESVQGEHTTGGALVRLACIDDDALEQELSVLWDAELDARARDDARLVESIGEGEGFDRRVVFASYMDALRWGCTSSASRLSFNAPFRAGIRIEPYQMEPLAKALGWRGVSGRWTPQPRVNLFIADDVGLGKTIEAGLIAIELMARRRARHVVVCCPPAMIPQWEEEMAQRFGIALRRMDREGLQAARRKHGFAINPWELAPHHIISHNLLRDEAYAGPLKTWLGTLKSGSLLILDEAHHAAPAGGGRYAIESRFTRTAPEIGTRDERWRKEAPLRPVIFEPAEGFGDSAVQISEAPVWDMESPASVLASAGGIPASPAPGFGSAASISRSPAHILMPQGWSWGLQGRSRSRPHAM